MRDPEKIQSQYQHAQLTPLSFIRETVFSLKCNVGDFLQSPRVLLLQSWIASNPP